MAAGRRAGWLGLIGVLAWGLVAGCAGGRYETSAHFDTEYDFSRVASFALAPARTKSSDSESGRLVEEALREHLVARGYREVPRPEADVLVGYDVGRYAPAKLSGSNSFAITEGTLSVSVVDPETRRTVWYGWVETALGPEDQPDVVIGEAVDALFRDQLPRARAGSGGATDG